MLINIKLEMYKNIKIKLLCIFIIFTILFSDCVFAIGLKDGLYYYNKTDYYKSSWQWLDLNNDKIYECYYFNVLGHMMKDTETLDEYRVDKNGCLIVNNEVVRKTEEEVKAIYDNTNINTTLPSISKDSKSILKNYTISEITLEYTNELDEYIDDSIYEVNLYIAQKIIDKTLLVDLHGFYVKNLNKIKKEYYNKLLELDKDNDITHNDFNTLKKILNDTLVEKKKVLNALINNTSVNITWKFDKDVIKDKREDILKDK